MTETWDDPEPIRTPTTAEQRRERRFAARGLYDLLRERGVELRIEGGVLKWRAGFYGMTLDLIRRVKRLDRELKSEVRCRNGTKTVFDICAEDEARFDALMNHDGTETRV